MRIRIPPKKLRERFILIYELEGCQKAMNFLTRYYGIRRIKIIVDGRRVGNGNRACYFENRAYFTRRGLNKQTILHELYHHIAYANGVEETERKEEEKANWYAKKLSKRFT